MAFEIVANNLKRASDIKTLKLQNEEYSVTLFYFGDYASDMKNGSCIPENLSLSCKPKGDYFPIELLMGRVMLEVPTISILSISEIELFKLQLDIAGKAAKELQELIRDYFGIVAE